MTLSTLDVICNFLESQNDKNFLTMPGKSIWELGAEIRKFINDCNPPKVSSSMFPTYIGGWPSANFWYSEHSPFILTNILYSGQLLVKDPFADWFSDEQYLFPARLTSRPGYYRFEDKPDAKTGRNISIPKGPNIFNTRLFLHRVVPCVMYYKPLIDAGIIILLASKKFLSKNYKSITADSEAMYGKINISMEEFTHTFFPYELAVEDNTKGMFVFVGGDRERQISHQILDAIRYFISEYCFATHNGFNYIAPFRFEAYLCSEGLEKLLFGSPSERVVHAILNSDLPLYKNLTPDIIASIRDDDLYSSFRQQLYNIYRDIPSQASSREEYLKFISEAEQVMLTPILEDIKKSTQGGILSKLSLEALKIGVKMAGAVLIGKKLIPDLNPVELALGVGVPDAIGSAWDIIKNKTQTGPSLIWGKLFQHNMNARDILDKAIISDTGDNQDKTKTFWGIPEKKASKVFVSSGQILIDHMPIKGGGPERELKKTNKLEDCINDPYLECCCGSGRKYKFCCYGLNKIRIGPQH